MEIMLSPSLVTVMTAYSVFGILMIVIGVKLRKYDSLHINSNFQNIIELLFEGIGNTVEDILGAKYRDKFTPIAITIWVTVFMSNIAGLFAMTEGALDLNYTFTLVAMGFIFWNGYGIYKIGIVAFLKDFFTPIPVMAPLEVVSFLAKPVSLGLRLFGNILSGYIMMKIVFMIPVIFMGMAPAAGFISAPIIMAVGAILSIYFSLFGPFLQSMIFTYLILVNLSLLINEEE